ncbi:hypothetical protein TI05_07435 [Achromatium sp. WMS3]|nr:hypothetical protein TI05_07435 [Achromatium sp. WMS3]
MRTLHIIELTVPKIFMAILKTIVLTSILFLIHLNLYAHSGIPNRASALIAKEKAKMMRSGANKPQKNMVSISPRGSKKCALNVGKGTKDTKNIVVNAKTIILLCR